MTAHVKHLIIAGLVAAVVLLVTWKVLAHMGNIAHDQNVLAQQQVKEDLEKARLQANATKADNTLLQQKMDSLTASNEGLKRDVTGLRTQLAAQRDHDATLPPSELADRWNMLIGLQGVTPAANGLVADLPAAHATVDQLEQLPEKVAEIQKLTANSLVKDGALDQAVKTLGSTQAELNTCKTVTVPDMAKACDRKVSDVKDQARKGKFKAFFYGAVAAIGLLLGVKHGL